MTSPLSFKPKKELRDKITELANSDFKGITAHALNHITEKHFDMENQFAPLDDACPLLFYLGESEAPTKIGKGWYCLKKSPSEKLLGSGIIEAAAKYCKACKIRDGALEDSKLMKEQRTKGIKQTLAHCARGAKLNETLDEFEQCPKIGIKRPVMNRQKPKDYKPCRLEGKNNAQCEYLSFSTVLIKGKTPDLAKKR